MDLTLLEETDTTMEVEIEGESWTLLQLLKDRLLQKDEVDYATFFMGHQKLDTP